MALVIQFPTRSPRPGLTERLEPFCQRLGGILSAHFVRHQVTNISVVEALTVMLDTLADDGFDPDPDTLSFIVSSDEQMRAIAAGFLRRLAECRLIAVSVADDFV